LNNAPIPLADRTFLQWMSRWVARRMKSGSARFRIRQRQKLTISDKGIKAVLEAAINVNRPTVDLSAMRTGRSRQPAIAEQSRFMSAWPN
jgi:hypothetical protein